MNTRSTSKCSKFEDDFMKIYSFSSSLQKIKKATNTNEKTTQIPTDFEKYVRILSGKNSQEEKGGHMPIVNRLKVNLIIH